LKTKHSKAAQTKAFRTQKKNEHKSHDVYHERAPVRFTKKINKANLLIIARDIGSLGRLVVASLDHRRNKIKLSQDKPAVKIGHIWKKATIFIYCVILPRPYLHL